ncbi:hypothetical protein IEZ26_04055 [Nocardioides cavernae]|uniref:Uncharacterized protein n=1 Tax=Nocardioides cavernae TaxID=1921566 RepID=A0ABR8N6L2_9ACTN|nr:hypothetical protein [Nocardioides cavernae]MBD3923784.1 hypothetical protein [Nocardioides cavernae]MBM7511283.1 hypothetical protein [Nocardioides cavernae]
MRARAVVAHAVVATLLLAGAAQATSRGPADERRHLDLVASAQPSDQRRDDRDVVVDEVVVREGDLKADAVATSVTACHGCRGESAVLQVIYVPGPAAARFDNVATAWTQDCWDCRATALAVQVIVIGPGTRARPTNRALSVGGSCATCVTATAAFQVVAQVDAVGPLPDPVLAEITAWFDAQAAALRSAVVAPPAPRRAERAATRSLGDLRRVVVRALDGRTRSARVTVTR